MLWVTSKEICFYWKLANYYKAAEWYKAHLMIHHGILEKTRLKLIKEISSYSFTLFSREKVIGDKSG